MKSSRLLTTGSVMTSSRPESDPRKQGCYRVQTKQPNTTVGTGQLTDKPTLHSLVESRDVLLCAAAASRSFNINITLGNSLQCSPPPLREGDRMLVRHAKWPLRRVGRVKMHQWLPANLSQTNDPSCRAQWSPYTGLAASIPITLSCRSGKDTVATGEQQSSRMIGW